MLHYSGRDKEMPLMSGVAGRSGRKTFVPSPEQRNNVKVLTAWGSPSSRFACW